MKILRIFSTNQKILSQYFAFSLNCQLIISFYFLRNTFIKPFFLQRSNVQIHSRSKTGSSRFPISRGNTFSDLWQLTTAIQVSFCGGTPPDFALIMETGQVLEKNKNIVIDYKTNLIVFYDVTVTPSSLLATFLGENTIGSSLGRDDWTF